jgi:hypothetical protein
MDEQRLEEIAEKAFWEIESHVYANRDTLAKMVIGNAIREALSSQEEELRKARDEQAEWYDRATAAEAETARLTGALLDVAEQRDAAAACAEQWESKYHEEWCIVDGIWATVRRGQGYPGEEVKAVVADYVKRAESAEAEVKRLLDAVERLGSMEAFSDVVWNNWRPETAGYRAELRARVDFARAALPIKEAKS